MWVKAEPGKAFVSICKEKRYEQQAKNGTVQLLPSFGGGFTGAAIRNAAKETTGKAAYDPPPQRDRFVRSKA